MISTSLNTIKNDPLLNNKLKKAIEFLSNNDLETIKAGVHEIEGKKLFAQVIDFETNDRLNIKAESHIKYIDMQYLVNGEEKLEFITNNGDYVYDEYIKERDILFYNSNIKNESYTIATKGSINLFFPKDIHVPGIKVNEKKMLRKIVIKIDLNYFNNIN